MFTCTVIWVFPEDWIMINATLINTSPGCKVVHFKIAIQYIFSSWVPFGKIIPEITPLKHSQH